MIDYYETKAHPVTKKMVWEAYKSVRANRGSAGIDQVSLDDYEKDLKGNLYKLWNRLTSGSYFPDNVREVQIPKKSGGYRGLGIPTVSDRVAQQVVKSYLEPKVDGKFHADSYGYRRGKSAHDALETAKQRCYKYRWVIDLDIKGFFDNIDHDLMMKALKQFTNEKWMLLYVERWLKVGVVSAEGTTARTKGTPQGGVISPLLANIYLHFTFDKWMEKHNSHIVFERYCDDIIIHCRTLREAEIMKEVIRQRFQACKLELNDGKTHVVYCKNAGHREKHDKVSFGFLGYTFRPRVWKYKERTVLAFGPCMSQQSKQAARDKLRGLGLHRNRGTIGEIADKINPMIRGWMNYYCRYNKWSTVSLWKFVNRRLILWIKRCRGFSTVRAFRWLRGIYNNQPGLFAHWTLCKP